MSRRNAPPRRFSLTLGQALPKGSTMDDIVRKATELGAARIVPLVTERTQVHLASDRSDRKTEKWQTVALEAAKQCGNPWLPDLAAPIALPAFLTAPTSFDLKLVASLEPTARSLKPVLDAFTSAHGRPPASVLWLVGPEGDFSPAEHASLRAAGFEPITLGPLVLRCETAAIAALSILTYELLNR